MNIQDKIKIDLKKSIIEGDNIKKNLLRTIIGEFNRFEKDIDDDKALSIIKKMKENAESLNNYDEIEILHNYLPNMLTEGEINDYITELFENNNYTIKDMGKIMKELKDEFGQSMDMKIASNIVKKYLNK
jgi:uncharacterized protein YqeY